MTGGAELATPAPGPHNPGRAPVPFPLISITSTELGTNPSAGSSSPWCREKPLPGPAPAPQGNYLGWRCVGRARRRWRCPVCYSAGGAGSTHIPAFAFPSCSAPGAESNDPEMNQARPRYVIERPAYSLSLFDEEFEKKSRTYPVGDKLRNLFR